jgi:hypothetical protein
MMRECNLLTGVITPQKESAVYLTESHSVHLFFRLMSARTTPIPI